MVDRKFKFDELGIQSIKNRFSSFTRQGKVVYIPSSPNPTYGIIVDMLLLDSALKVFRLDSLISKIMGADLNIC